MSDQPQLRAPSKEEESDGRAELGEWFRLPGVAINPATVGPIEATIDYSCGYRAIRFGFVLESHACYALYDIASGFIMDAYIQVTLDEVRADLVGTLEGPPYVVWWPTYTSDLRARALAAENGVPHTPMEPDGQPKELSLKERAQQATDAAARHEEYIKAVKLQALRPRFVAAIEEWAKVFSVPVPDIGPVEDSAHVRFTYDGMYFVAKMAYERVGIYLNMCWDIEIRTLEDLGRALRATAPTTFYSRPNQG